MFRPDRHAQLKPKDNLEQREDNQPTLLERLRTMPGGKSLFAVLAVLGQLSLYAPKRLELTPKPTGELFEPIQTDADARAFIEAALPPEVQVDITADTIVITDTSHPEATSYREFVFPGEQIQQDFSVNMRWAGRGYEHGAKVNATEAGLMAGVIDAVVERQLLPIEQLGVSADDLVTEVEIIAHGLASPEGTVQGNKKVSQKRGELGLELATHAYITHDIAEEKIHGTVIGGGAEGTINGFIRAIAGQGKVLNQEQALQLIQRIHDGQETDPALVQIFQDEIAAHRRADITTVLHLADVVLRVPDLPGAPDAETIPALEYYAPRNPQPTKPEPVNPPPPVDPPPPPPLPYKRLQPLFAEIRKQAKPKDLYLPGKQYATGLGPTKGETIGRGPSRQGFKSSARKHHTGKR